MFNKTITRNAAFNVIKQCVGILVPIIIYPVISRRLGVKSFGRVNFADSVVSCFMIIAMLGISSYAVREGARIRDTKSEIQKFSNEVFTLNLTSLLVALVSLCLLTIVIPRLNSNVVIIAIFAIGMINTTIGRDWINVVYEDYAYISIRYVIFHIIGMILALLLVRESDDYWVYALILVLMNTAANLINIFYSQKYSKYGLANFSALSKHVKPVLFLFFISLAVRIYVNSDIVMIGFLKDDTAVGIYSLATKIYIIVKTVLNAITAVTIPRLSELYGKGDEKGFSNMILQLRKALLFFAIPAAIGLIFLSHDIVYILGGTEYISGHRVLQVLVIAMTFAVFGNCYANAMLIPMRKEKRFALATSVSAVLNIILNLVLIPYMGIIGAAISTVISEVVVLFMCKRSVTNYLIRLEKKYVIKVLFCSLLVGGCSYLISLLTLQPIWNIVITTIAGLAVYFAFQFLLDKKMIRELLSFKR